MRFTKIGLNYLVKLEKSEEIVETLTKFCVQQKISTGVLTAIGAFNQAILGSYNLETKSYNSKEFNGDLEVTSLNGNISLLEDKPFLHIHTNISDHNFNVYGGHLKMGIVGVTLEVYISAFEKEITRSFSDEIGLNLLDLEQSA